MPSLVLAHPEHIYILCYGRPSSSSTVTTCSTIRLGTTRSPTTCATLASNRPSRGSSNTAPGLHITSWLLDPVPSATRNVLRVRRPVLSVVRASGITLRALHTQTRKQQQHSPLSVRALSWERLTVAVPYSRLQVAAFLALHCSRPRPPSLLMPHLWLTQQSHPWRMNQATALLVYIRWARAAAPHTALDDLAKTLRLEIRVCDGWSEQGQRARSRGRGPVREPFAGQRARPPLRA